MAAGAPRRLRLHHLRLDSAQTRTSTRCSRGLALLGRAIRGDVVLEHPLAAGRRAGEAARRHFAVVEAVVDPTAQFVGRRARRARSRDGLALLLADLEAETADEKALPHARTDRRSHLRARRSRGIVGIAFAAGYILGKLLL